MDPSVISERLNGTNKKSCAFYKQYCAICEHMISVCAKIMLLLEKDIASYRIYINIIVISYTYPKKHADYTTFHRIHLYVSNQYNANISFLPQYYMFLYLSTFKESYLRYFVNYIIHYGGYTDSAHHCCNYKQLTNLEITKLRANAKDHITGCSSNQND